VLEWPIEEVGFRSIPPASSRVVASGAFGGSGRRVAVAAVRATDGLISVVAGGLDMSSEGAGYADAWIRMCQQAKIKDNENKIHRVSTREGVTLSYVEVSEYIQNEEQRTTTTAYLACITTDRGSFRMVRPTGRRRESRNEPVSIDRPP